MTEINQMIRFIEKETMSSFKNYPFQSTIKYKFNKKNILPQFHQTVFLPCVNIMLMACHLVSHFGGIFLSICLSIYLPIYVTI